MRRTLNDLLITGASVVLVLLALAFLHRGLRTEMLRVFREAPSSSLALVSERARDSAALALRSTWDQASDYDVFAIFIVVACVVFVCLLKLRPGR